MFLILKIVFFNKTGNIYYENVSKFKVPVFNSFQNEIYNWWKNKMVAVWATGDFYYGIYICFSSRKAALKYW